MNIPIKFRGKRIDDGLLVCGNCLHQYPDGKVAISHVTKLALTFVDPDSVAQLVGYDADGKEIYVGDYVELVVNGKQYVYQAHLEGFATADDGRYLCPKQLPKTRVIA